MAGKLICLLALLILLLTCVPSPAADPADGDTDAGFTFRESFWWKDSLPYTRTQVQSSTPGGYYYSCGRYYQYAPSYSHSWQYSRAALAYKDKVVERQVYQPAVPQYSADWKTDVLKYAQKKDDLQAYLNALQALGINGQTYGFQQNSYRYSSYNYGQPLNLNAQTQYGYSYQTVKEAYGETNLNLLYQQSARLAQNGQQLGSQATTEFAQLVAAAGDNQARVAEILARARAAELALRATDPQPRSRTTETVQGQGAGAVPPQPRTPMPQAEPTDVVDAKTFLNNVAIPLCGACHAGGANAKSKFNIADYPTLSLDDKRVVWRRLLTDNPDKRMPQKDGGPGDPLTAQQLQAFFTH